MLAAYVKTMLHALGMCQPDAKNSFGVVVMLMTSEPHLQLVVQAALHIHLQQQRLLEVPLPCCPTATMLLGGERWGQVGQDPRWDAVQGVQMRPLRICTSIRITPQMLGHCPQRSPDPEQASVCAVW